MRRDRPRVSRIRFSPASRREQENGLLAYVACRVGNMRLDGLTVRRSLRGQVLLSYPCRRDRAGVDHAYVFPSDERAGREIERQVLDAFHAQGAAP